MCQANVKMYSEGLTFNSFPLCYMCYKYDMARYIDKKWKLLLQMTVGIYRTVFSIATTCIMCILRSQTCSVLLLLLSRCFVSESFVTLIYTLLNKLLWKNKTTPCTDSHLTSSNYTLTIVFCVFYLFFKRSTFVGSAWTLGFFIPATTANDLRLRRIFYPRFYPLLLCSCLIFITIEWWLPLLLPIQHYNKADQLRNVS